MLKIFKFIAYFLERSERNYPTIFWLCSFLLGFCLFHEPVATSSQSEIVIEQVHISRGGGSKTDSSSFFTPICLSKRKYFDLTFHRRLEQYFSDWKERIDYKKKQEKFYKLAMPRKKELKRLGVLDKKSYYTKEELDAMDYFYGTGFYQKQQYPEVNPNIFDTRQSLLRKMHDPIALDNFLDSFNRQ